MGLVYLPKFTVKITLPKFNSSPLKRYLPNRKVVFQPTILQDFGRVILHICKYSPHHPNPSPVVSAGFVFSWTTWHCCSTDVNSGLMGIVTCAGRKSRETTIVECNFPTLWMAKYHHFFLIPNVDTVPARLYVRLKIKRSRKRWKTCFF